MMKTQFKEAKTEISARYGSDIRIITLWIFKELNNMQRVLKEKADNMQEQLATVGKEMI